MDLTIIMTVVGTAIAIIGSNVDLISWIRSDLRSFEAEVRGWRDDINKEMKDFHDKLCTYEERHKPKTNP